MMPFVIGLFLSLILLAILPLMLWVIAVTLIFSAIFVLIAVLNAYKGEGTRKRSDE